LSAEKEMNLFELNWSSLQLQRPPTGARICCRLQLLLADAVSCSASNHPFKLEMTALRRASNDARSVALTPMKA
jgi:hypothetical protein